jgi:hypothetical protein
MFNGCRLAMVSNAAASPISVFMACWLATVSELLGIATQRPANTGVSSGSHASTRAHQAHTNFDLYTTSKLLYVHDYTGCLKKSFTSVNAYINLFRRLVQYFELS